MDAALTKVGGKDWDYKEAIWRWAAPICEKAAVTDRCAAANWPRPALTLPKPAAAASSFLIRALTNFVAVRKSG